MEEEILEQPETERAQADQAETMSVDSAEGSVSGKLGKFKSVDALLEAYSSLEAEFTRKSQRLSELEKDQTQKANRSDEEIESELSRFLSEKSEAAPYRERLVELAKGEDGKVDFQKLWASVMIETLQSNQSKIDNPIIKNYILKDEELKNLVVENYMKDLKANKPPFVIRGESGEKVTGVVPVTPQSLSDAKILVEEMFS